MSMSYALTGTRDWLHDSSASGITWGDPAIALNKDVCYLAWEARPQRIGGAFAICIDDGGTDTTNSDNYYVGETYTMLVGIWRRIGKYSIDRLAQQMYIPNDLYATNAKSLEDLERDIVTALHQNYAVRAAVNTAYSLPGSGLGDKFLSPWCYKGRGEVEALPFDDQNAYLGRVLRFTGFMRNQAIDGAA